jgi:hypothetical protein
MGLPLHVDGVLRLDSAEHFRPLLDDPSGRLVEAIGHGDDSRLVGATFEPGPEIECHRG